MHHSLAGQKIIFAVAKTKEADTQDFTLSATGRYYLVNV